ncbi:MAG: superoxide dismutase family protein [Bacteroidales bacterium]|nr:superoxide dismutase family protein [Bacteroidales bacterium]
MKTRIIAITISLLFVVFSISAQDHAAMQMTASSEQLKAICVLYPTDGNEVSGIVTFTSTPDGVKVTADVLGLSPGKHGFHVHEFGDCSAPDGTSAGGHFNPEHMKHGGPQDQMRHEGDLGNLEADETGRARMTFIDKDLMLSGPHSIVGYSIIVHAQEDDLISQPTGNAGARVACGVIGVMK